MTRRNGERGFTLVELLVALFIFSLLSLAGVMLLRTSARAQTVLSSRLDDLAALTRLVTTLDSDLLLAQPVATAGSGGALAPAFSLGGPGGALFSFTRAASGRAEEPGAGAPLSITYGLAEGRLTRTSAPAGAAGPSAPALLLRDLIGAQLRVRGADGRWSSSWASSNPQDLPRALEVVLTPRHGGPITLMFVVGTQQRPDQVAPAPSEEQGAPALGGAGG